MTTKKITVDTVGGVKLSTDAGLDKWLENKKVQCLIDSEGDEVVDFDSLVHGGKYKLGPMDGKSVLAQVDPEKINYIYAQAKKQEEDERTLQLSKPSLAGYTRAVQNIGVRIDAPEWDPDENTKSNSRKLGKLMKDFSWQPGKEESKENRTLYMDYLRNNISLPANGKLFDGSNGGYFLSAEMASLEVKTKGNIDVVMAAERHQKIDTTIRNMWAGIELKRQDNNSTQEIRRQVILQHLSNSYLNEDTGILTIMTDLGPRWRFYWFSKGGNALMEYHASSKGEAKYLIQHMKDTGDTSAPTDFLNRASWNQMFLPPSGSDGIMDGTEGEGGNGGDGGEDDGGGNDDEDDTGGTSDRPTKKQALSDTDGQPQSSGGGSGVGETALALSLDFMDEEEEREARFRDVLKCMLPQLGVFPPQMRQKDRHGEGPPTPIGVS